MLKPASLWPFHPRNRGIMAGWVKGPLFNQKDAAAATASYCTATQKQLLLDRETRKTLEVLNESQGFANNVLISHEGHVAVSPSSFHVILNLLAAGSGGWSHYHFLDFFDVGSVDQINASGSLLNDVILAHSDDSSFGPRIRSSTSLWHHHSLSLDPYFLGSLHNAHRASLFPVDFHSKTPLVRQQINSKVEHDTSGLIKDLISEESLSNSSSIEIVFTNTLHFKGDWDINDDMQNPTNRLRYDHLGSQDDDYFCSERLVGAEIIAVKRNIMVERDDVACLILGNKFRRPSKDKCHVNLNCYYPRPPLHTYDMDSDTYSFETSSYSIPNETLMEVAGREIPKFNVSSEVDASTMLRTNGMILPFYGGGLTRMLDPYHLDLTQELYLFKILQKTFINLNEQGSEAATTTTAIVVSGCPPHLPPVPCMGNKCYGTRLLEVGGGMMARVGLEVLHEV